MNTKLGKKKLLMAILRKKTSKLEPDVITKLRQAFAIGCGIEEACFYAEIHRTTYWRWLKKYPELEYEFGEMQQRLGLKAKENVAARIEAGDVDKSIWYLERTQPKTYAETQKHEHSGEVSIPQGYPEDEELKKEFRERFLQNIIKREQERKKNEANSQTKSENGSQNANPV